MRTRVLFSRSGMGLRHLVAVACLAESLIGELVSLLFSLQGALLRLQGRGDRVVAHIAGAHRSNVGP